MGKIGVICFGGFICAELYLIWQNGIFSTDGILNKANLNNLIILALIVNAMFYELENE